MKIKRVGWMWYVFFPASVWRIGWRPKPKAAGLDDRLSTPALCGTGNPEAGDYAGLIEKVKDVPWDLQTK